MATTMTEPKFVGRSMIAWGPPMSPNIRIDNAKSLIMSRNLSSILVIAEVFWINLFAFSELLMQSVISDVNGRLARSSITLMIPSMQPGYFAS